MIRAVLLASGLVLLGPGDNLAGPGAAPPSEVRAVATLDSLYALEKYAEVVSRARRLLATGQVGPAREWQVLERLGLSLHRLGRSAEAIPFLERAVRLAPAASSVHLNLGTALMALGHRGRAFSEFQEAVDLEPQNWRARLDFGLALLLFDLTDLARTHLETANLLCSGCLEVARALARLYLQEEDFARAVAPLARLYEVDPTAEVRQNLALAYFQCDEYERVHQLLLPGWYAELSGQERLLVLEADRVLRAPDRARELARSLPDGYGEQRDPLFWGLVSLICLEADLCEEGLAAVDLAIYLAPENATFRNNRVVLLTRLNRHEEAQQEWERVLELEPGLAENEH